MKFKKSQLSLEFMSFLALGVVFAMVFLIMVKMIINDQTKDKDVAEIRDFGYSVQRELILASEVEPGYERQIVIPNKVDSIEYSINNTERLLIVTFSGSDHIFYIPNVSGTIVKGTNTIRNIGGSVYIE